MSFVANSNISVIPRLLLNAGVQFGVAGLGITIVCILRKESFTHFGLIRKNIFKAIIGTIICFVPSICYIFLSGQFNGYQPFSILITDDVIASGIPFSILGIRLIKLPMKGTELDYADSLKRAFQNLHIFISSDTEEDVEIIKNTFERWRDSQ